MNGRNTSDTGLSRRARRHRIIELRRLGRAIRARTQGATALRGFLFDKLHAEGAEPVERALQAFVDAPDTHRRRAEAALLRHLETLPASQRQAWRPDEKRFRRRIARERVRTVAWRSLRSSRARPAVRARRRSRTPRRRCSRRSGGGDDPGGSSGDGDPDSDQDDVDSATRGRTRG